MGGLVASSPALRPALRWLLPGAASAVHCSLLVLPTHSGQASAVRTQAASVLVARYLLQPPLLTAQRFRRGFPRHRYPGRVQRGPLCRSFAPRLYEVEGIGELRGLRAARSEEREQLFASNERKAPK